MVSFALVFCLTGRLVTFFATAGLLRRGVRDAGVLAVTLSQVTGDGQTALIGYRLRLWNKEYNFPDSMFLGT